MKNSISIGVAVIGAAVVFFGAYWLFSGQIATVTTTAEADHAAPPPPASIARPAPAAPAPPVIPIPDTMITLKRELQFKDAEGNIALVVPAGEQLVSDSTQGLEYIVVREGRTIRIHCDDAYESHGHFTEGRVEHLAVQMAQEIRAEGRVPTNERVVARAIQAVEEHRIEGSPSDLQTELESLQNVLLLHH